MAIKRYVYLVKIVLILIRIWCVPILVPTPMSVNKGRMTSTYSSHLYFFIICNVFPLFFSSYFYNMASYGEALPIVHLMFYFKLKGGKIYRR
jgi:hypothetical protein